MGVVRRGGRALVWFGGSYLMYLYYDWGEKSRLFIIETRYICRPMCLSTCIVSTGWYFDTLDNCVRYLKVPAGINKLIKTSEQVASRPSFMGSAKLRRPLALPLLESCGRAIQRPSSRTRAHNPPIIAGN